MSEGAVSTAPSEGSLVVIVRLVGRRLRGTAVLVTTRLLGLLLFFLAATAPVHLHPLMHTLVHPFAHTVVMGRRCGRWLRRWGWSWPLRRGTLLVLLVLAVISRRRSGMGSQREGCEERGGSEDQFHM
jgi:hypothetical protein